MTQYTLAQHRHCCLTEPSKDAHCCCQLAAAGAAACCCSPSACLLPNALSRLRLSRSCASSCLTSATLRMPWTTLSRVRTLTVPSACAHTHTQIGCQGCKGLSLSSCVCRLLEQRGGHIRHATECHDGVEGQAPASNTLCRSHLFLVADDQDVVVL